MNWALLKNSLIVSGATTVLALALGFLAALRLATVPRRTRAFLLAATLVTLALPPFLVINSWLDLFGAAGPWRRWLPIPLYSLGGTVAVLTFMLWPISALLTLGAWDRIEPAQLEADPALRHAALLRWVLWPAAQNALALAGVLTFVLAFNQFTVPVILQVPVFPEELWLALTTRLNEAGAWVAAGPMIIVPGLLWLVARRVEIPWPRQSGTDHGRALRRQLGPGWSRFATIIAGALLAVGLLLPLGQLVLQLRTWTELPGLFKASRNVVLNSVASAALSATVSLAVGLMTRRWRSGWALWLLLFVPGILLGRGLIVALGGTVLYGTMFMVLIAFTLRYAAVGWQGTTNAMRAVDPNLVDAGRMEGLRGWALFRHHVWPQLATPMAAAWYVIYLLILWDVETLVLIYPPGGETLSLRIFNLLHYGHNAQVNAMCVALLGLAALPLAAWALLRAVAGLRGDP